MPLDITRLKTANDRRHTMSIIKEGRYSYSWILWNTKNVYAYIGFDQSNRQLNIHTEKLNIISNLLNASSDLPSRKNIEHNWKVNEIFVSGKQNGVQIRFSCKQECLMALIVNINAENVRPFRSPWIRYKCLSFSVISCDQYSSKTACRNCRANLFQIKCTI